MRKMTMNHPLLPVLLGLLTGLVGLSASHPESVRYQGKIQTSTVTLYQPYSGQGVEDEFLVEPKTYVRLRADIFEIRPSETNPIASPTLRTENGKPAEIIIGSGRGSLSIRITPSVVEKKGVELKIEYQAKPEMAAGRVEKTLVQNGEAAVIELYENQATKSKIGLKITPLLEVAAPTKEYPGPVRELHLDDSFLIKDDDKLIAHGDLSATSDLEEISLWFTDNEGLFVLGFKRFEGAEPRGYAQGNVIKIKFGESLYKWMSRNPVMPEGKWLVWVRRVPQAFRGLSVENGQAILGKNGMIGIGMGKDAWKRMLMERPLLPAVT